LLRNAADWKIAEPPAVGRIASIDRPFGEEFNYPGGILESGARFQLEILRGGADEIDGSSF